MRGRFRAISDGNLRAFEALLTLALVSSAGLLVARAIIGPFEFLARVRNPIPLESCFGVAAILLILIRSREAPSPHPSYPALAQIALIGAALTLLTAAFWGWAAGFPFVADDYHHITNGMRASLSSSARLFVEPPQESFFRPLGVAVYAIQAHIWQNENLWWRAMSFALHTANSVMLFLLLSRYGLARWPAVFGAVLFLVHGTRPEAVVWTGAQFDLWSTFFFLAAFLAFDTWVRTSGLISLAAALGALFCALFFKESSYVAPLVFLVSPALAACTWRVRFARVAPVLLLCLMCFCYRWFILGGIGGYLDANRRPFIYSVGLRTIKAFASRVPAVLAFPLNWDEPIEWWLNLLLLAGIGGWILLTRAHVSRFMLVSGGFILLASLLPVHELLLISSDLEKSRILYLPLIGFSLICSALLAGLPRASRLAAAACILAFNAGALEHNLKIWLRNGLLAQQTCASIARQLPSSGKEPVLSDVPNIIDGVYFLKTGLRNCIEWSAGRPLPELRIHGEPWGPVVTEPPDLVWSDSARAFVPARR
jgi:hypothetical protein